MVILWVPYKLHYGVAILGVPGNCHWWPRGVPYLGLLSQRTNPHLGMGLSGISLVGRSRGPKPLV